MAQATRMPYFAPAWCHRLKLKASKNECSTWNGKGSRAEKTWQSSRSRTGDVVRLSNRSPVAFYRHLLFPEAPKLAQQICPIFKGALRQIFDLRADALTWWHSFYGVSLLSGP